MRRALACVVLWGCVPTVDLKLPSTDPPAEAWLFLDPARSEAIAFDADQPIEFAAAFDAELIAVAYSVSLERLQIEPGAPLRLAEEGARRLPMSGELARAFVSSKATGGERTWRVAEAPGEYWLGPLQAERCFEQGFCRPAAQTFDFCSEVCGATGIDTPVSPALPAVDPTPTPVCAAGEHPFPGGCRRVGAACPPGTWPSDLPPGAHLVDGDFQAFVEALAAAQPGDTIAVQGVIESPNRALVIKPLIIRGTCPERASIPGLIVGATGVVLDSLLLEGVYVREGGAAVVRRSNLTLQASGRVEVEDSVVRQLDAAFGGVTFSRSVLSGELNAGASPLSFHDTVLTGVRLLSRGAPITLSNVRAVESSLTLREGSATIAGFVQERSEAGVTAEDLELQVVDSVLTTLSVLRGSVVLNRVELFPPPGRGALAVFGDITVQIQDLRVSSSDECLSLHGSIHLLRRLDLTCGRNGITVRQVLRNTMTNLEDARISAEVGIDAQGGLDVTRAIISSAIDAVDLSAGGHKPIGSGVDVVTLDHVVLDARATAIVASDVGDLDVRQFSIAADHVALDLTGAAGSLLFDAGTLRAPTGVLHSGIAAEEIFIRTRFETLEPLRLQR